MSILDILILAAVVFWVVLALRKLLRDRRAGKGCGCGCEGCPGCANRPKGTENRKP